ncbi:selenoprotein L [Elysia marginata]|uniref:Selenoprotein L n=1 Tax=Elysia marginata TaxID=1093978 RepID=A0AAV4FVC2_9GAST|nr:selenoprotein L [Elysia marginata]
MPLTLDTASAVVTSLVEISHHCKEIILHAKECAKGDVEQFISRDIGKLFKVVWTYKNAFERLQVTNKTEFEKAVSHEFWQGNVREEFDEVLESEQVWDEFLLEVDSQLVVSNDRPLVKGDLFPSNLSLIDARTGQPTTVESFIGPRELFLAGCKVLLVSFGEEYGAKRWLEETGSSFDMVLDPQRKIYQAFGLNRSVSKVWSIECMCFYAEKLIQGRTFPTPLENVHDDPQQMGGDFILDAAGTVILTHCSKISSDRPSMETLLSVLRSMDSTSKLDELDQAKDSTIKKSTHEGPSG